MESIVRITGLAYGGRGVGRIDGKVIFVPFTAPGDEARVKVVAEKKGFSEGLLVELVVPSPMRTAPPCPVFGLCGGCALQHLRYPEQVVWKEKIFEETLKRIGRVEDISFDEPVPSGAEFFYRQRARFQIKEGRWGFFEAGSNRVVDIENCPIVHPSINAAFGRIKAIFQDEFKDDEMVPRLTSLEAGFSPGDGGTVAAFHLSGEKGAFKSDSWIEDILRKVEGIKGIEVWIKTLKAGKRVVSVGDTRLVYSLGEIKYAAGISVFSQINLLQNSEMVKKVIEYANLSGTERALEIFSGVGNLTLPMAKKAGRITGIESSKEAVTNARENAALNSIGSASFIRSEAGVWLKSNIKKIEKEGLDVVVLDPPRGGDPEVTELMAGLRPGKVIYVSCSPPTLARDISILARHGFKRFKACLIDMFPQTYHIEGIVAAQS